MPAEGSDKLKKSFLSAQGPLSLLESGFFNEIRYEIRWSGFHVMPLRGSDLFSHGPTHTFRSADAADRKSLTDWGEKSITAVKGYIAHTKSSPLRRRELLLPIIAGRSLLLQKEETEGI